MRIIYPPRPRGKMEPRLLPVEESRNSWIAQYKYKGIRCLIYIDSNKNVRLYNRHGKELSKLQLDANLRSQILSLNIESGKEYVFDSELMHATTSLQRTFIVYDLLWEGRYLHFVKQMERLSRLEDLCGNPSEMIQGLALKVTDNIWMAPYFVSDFSSRFDDAFPCEHREGLVLRKKESSLDNSGAKEYLVSWLLRCRKPAKISGAF